MDNLAHTLVGLAIGEAGLKRRTALGTATLIIGANLPDVDALTYLVGSGTDALAFRRGWTHGVVAMAVLPFLLVGLMLAWDRVTVRRRRRGARAPVRAGWLLALAAISILSHPLLDLLNTYGVRLLMPFSNRWFYGDTLFIVDPWLWMALAAGVLVSRWRGRRLGIRTGQGRPSREHAAAERPARVALTFVLVYVAGMAAWSRVGRVLVDRSQPAGVPARTMAGPVPLVPARRAIVRDLGGRYETGVLEWGLPPSYTRTQLIAVGADAPGVSEAAATRDGIAFLSWSRYPRFESSLIGDSLRVVMSDVRYADERGRGWASVAVMVPAAPLGGARTRAISR